MDRGGGGSNHAVLRLPANGNVNPAAPAAPAALPAARNSGTYHGTWEIVPFVNRTFEWEVVIATILSVLYCASPLCPFDLLSSPRIEENQWGARYPTANYPYPAVPALHKKHSQCTPSSGLSAAVLLQIQTGLKLPLRC